MKTDKVDKKEGVKEGQPKIGDKIKVEGKKSGFFVSAKITGIKGDMISYETNDGDFGNINRNNSEKISFKSSESDLEKAKADKKQQKKIKKVMDEWKAGTLLDPHGNKITDRKQVLAVALSEAGLSKKK